MYLPFDLSELLGKRKRFVLIRLPFQIFYICFLLLYSYVILFDFHLSISVAEWALIGWIGTMMVEEVREVRAPTSV